MRTETTYYAFDDTEFDNEEDCLAYEKKLKGSLNGARFFDENYEELFVDTDDPERIDESVYVHILDGKAAAALFAWLREYTGVCLPEGEYNNNDMWFYDTDQYDWVNATEKMRELTKVVKKITVAEMGRV